MKRQELEIAVVSPKGNVFVTASKILELKAMEDNIRDQLQKLRSLHWESYKLGKDSPYDNVIIESKMLVLKIALGEDK